MRDQTVAIFLMAKTPKGWKRLKPAYDSRKRIRPNFGMYEGKPVHFEESRYQLRSYKGRKDVWESIKGTATDAVNARDMKLKRSRAVQAAADVGAEVKLEPDRKVIRKEALRFVEDTRQRGAKEATLVNHLATEEFIAHCSKTHVDEITREDILAFHKVLRQRGLSERTVANKDARIRAFFLFCGVDLKKVFPPKPKYETKLPSTYSADEIKALLETANPYMRLVIELGLKCGLREQEIMHLEFKDIDFAHSVLRVRSKPLYEFKVKDSEERDIPVPSDLLELLQAERKEAGVRQLVLPAPNGGPNKKMLRLLKRLARKAGLNCGQCEGCRGKDQECQRWKLHELRRTYCTSLLRNGIDVATAQAFMGHSDMASTMRYLRPATSAETQAKINQVKWG